jgi:hypothetical protein
MPYNVQVDTSLIFQKNRRTGTIFTFVPLRYANIYKSLRLTIHCTVTGTKI